MTLPQVNTGFAHVREPAADYQSTYTPGWGYLIPQAQAPTWLYDSWAGIAYTMPAATQHPAASGGGGNVPAGGNGGGGSTPVVRAGGGNLPVYAPTYHRYYGGGAAGYYGAAAPSALSTLTSSPLVLGALAVGAVLLLTGKKK